MKGTAEASVPQCGDDLSQSSGAMNPFSSSIPGVPVAKLNFNPWPPTLLGPAFHSVWALEIVQENHLRELVSWAITQPHL